MLMLSCAAGYAGAAVNGLSATAEVPTTVLRAAAIIIRQLTDASTRTHTAGTEEGAHERAGFGQGQHANGVACDGAHQQRPPPVREGQPGHRQEFPYVTASHTRWVLQPSQPPAHTTRLAVGNYPLENIGSKDGQYRILSLDGGGLRAVMEAVILTRLTEVRYLLSWPAVRLPAVLSWHT